MKMPRRILATTSLIGVCLIGLPAYADESDPWQSDTLTGDWGGARGDLFNHGVDVGLAYVGEALGDVSGGMKRGWSYEGRAEFDLDLDLDKLLGWRGGFAHGSVFQIHHGNGTPAVNYTGSIGDPSNIEARQTTRLYTLWLQQDFFDAVVSIRAGQLAADDEFITSDTAGNLINGTFGWPALASANQTNGGPAYPLPTPGVRLALAPTSDITFLVGVFSGDPAGEDCFEDAQLCNRHGTTFSMSGGTLWMGELQYAIGQGESGLPGVYKIGGWYETGAFSDQRQGFSRAGDHGLYAVADQTVWRDGETRALSLLRAWAARRPTATSFPSMPMAGSPIRASFRGATRTSWPWASDIPGSAPTRARPTATFKFCHPIRLIRCATTRPSSKSATRRRSRVGGMCSRMSSTSCIPAAMCKTPKMRRAARSTMRWSLASGRASSSDRARSFKVGPFRRAVTGARELASFG